MEATVAIPAPKGSGPIEIPNFVLEREIGRGGMSRVYLGRQIEPRRKVAIKIVSPQSADDPAFLQALKDEGDTIAALNHDNVVTVYACGLVQGHYYLAMEVLAGGDLTDRIKKGALPPDEAVEVMIQIGSALGHAHSRGILHRDIKPENIMFHENGKAVLVDFGIAKEGDAESSFTRVGAVVGTPHYMSPERALGKPIDARSDLYAMGVVFYEMLTGKKVFEGKDTFAVTYAHVYETPPPLPAEHARFQPILDRLLAKDVEQRFQNAEQMVAALKRYRSPGTLGSEFATRAVGPFSLLPPQTVETLRKPIVWGPAAAVAALAIGALVWSLWPEPPLRSGPELSPEQRVQMENALMAASSFFNLNDTDAAELNYARVLEEFDCAHPEARSRMRALNPEREAAIAARCKN